jgi:hypothetical protein
MSDESFLDRLADTFAGEGPLDDTALAADIEATVPEANREARARDFHEHLRERAHWLRQANGAWSAYMYTGDPGDRDDALYAAERYHGNIHLDGQR